MFGYKELEDKIDDLTKKMTIMETLYTRLDADCKMIATDINRLDRIRT